MAYPWPFLWICSCPGDGNKNWFQPIIVGKIVGKRDGILIHSILLIRDTIKQGLDLSLKVRDNL